VLCSHSPCLQKQINRPNTGARADKILPSLPLSFPSQASEPLLPEVDAQLAHLCSHSPCSHRKPTRLAAPSPRASLGRRTVCGRTEQRRPPVSKRSETKVRMVWGSFLIAAAALKTPTRNGYNVQGVNLTFPTSSLPGRTTRTPLFTLPLFTPSSRHLRALLSVCGRCSFGGLGCCSCCVCVSVSGVLFSVSLCVCMTC